MVAGILLLPSHLHVSSSLCPRPLFTWSPIIQSSNQSLLQWPESRAKNTKTLLQIILVANITLRPRKSQGGHRTPKSRLLGFLLTHCMDHRHNENHMASLPIYRLPARTSCQVTHTWSLELPLDNTRSLRILHPSLLRSADNTHYKKK